MSGMRDIAPVLAALWPPGAERDEAYAVLDGARDRRIEALLRIWGLEHVCLYGEAIGAELRNAAPFLVRLERGTDSTEQLIERAWGHAWGVFAVAPAGTGMRAVTRHCRRLLRVLDERGRVMLFRYYDPRVMRCFARVRSTAQEHEVLGPLSDWLHESTTQGDAVERFRAAGQAAGIAALAEPRRP